MKKVDLSTFGNAAYANTVPRLKSAFWHIVNLLVLQNRLVPFSSFKKAVLRLFGARIGKGVVIKPGVNIKYPWNLDIGNYVWIGEGVWIDNLVQVTIEDHVCVSQGAFLLTGNHNYKSTSFDLIVSPIILETGVWVGAKAVVCPGVRCGTHAVLSVGSVATKNLESYKVYGGNPAVALRERVIN